MRRSLEKERRTLARLMVEEAREMSRAPYASSQTSTVLRMHGLWDKLYRIEEQLIEIRNAP